MKSLNDTLRDEYLAALLDPELSTKIEFNRLDLEILKKAFDVLLKFKSSPDLKDKARSEFENFIINHFRTLDNDN